MHIVSSILTITAISILAACGNSTNPAGPEAAAAPVAAAVNDISQNPDYKNGLALVAQSDCLTCHAIHETTTGPAYADIAAKYAGADDAKITQLAQTIIKGGKGNWGEVPMTPHPNLSEADAKQMVKYILLLKK